MFINCRKIDMLSELEKVSNISIPRDLSSEAANKYLLDVCEEFDVKCPAPHTTTRLLDKVTSCLAKACCCLYYILFSELNDNSIDVIFFSET